MKIYNQLPTHKIKEDTIFLHHTGKIFGVGCFAFCKEAVAKINLQKGRKSKSGFIVLIPNIDWLIRFNVRVTPQIHHILKQYWPGELSAILEVPDTRLEHISENGKVAFRIPTDKLLREFIVKIDQPIISTSVNESGEDPIQNLDEIISRFERWFDYAILPEKIQQNDNLSSTIIEFSNSKLKLIREGSIPFSEIEISYELPQILFVCTGNTCRSPIAEFLAKKIISEDNLNFRAASAGFMKVGKSISENSKSILASNGIDASKHKSTQLNEENLRRSWLILTMTEEHKKKILRFKPASASKVYTLSEFAGLSDDVIDPFGKNIEFYEKTFDEINKKLKITFEKIKEER
ncbi:MAG: hypothetical protein HOB92_07605 [Candidatus Cloacimonetes bacterium]|nr:hypothetical protein [Candidatus Cloacimonadota bacterium]